MRKIIIIDDRTKRQITLLGEETVSALRTINGAFMEHNIPSESDIEQYDYIAVHKSLLSQKERYVEMSEYCKKAGKNLILFSGGISEATVFNPRFIEMPASDFYNKEYLLKFVEKVTATDDDVNLLELLYGENWILSELIKYQHLKWMGIEDDDIEKEIDKTKDTLNKSVPDLNLDDDAINFKVFKLVHSI